MIRPALWALWALCRVVHLPHPKLHEDSSIVGRVHGYLVFCCQLTWWVLYDNPGKQVWACMLQWVKMLQPKKTAWLKSWICQSGPNLCATSCHSFYSNHIQRQYKNQCATSWSKKRWHHCISLPSWILRFHTAIDSNHPKVDINIYIWYIYNLARKAVQSSLDKRNVILTTMKPSLPLVVEGSTNLSPLPNGYLSSRIMIIVLKELWWQ